jgi:hypothetical protein
MAFNFVSVSTSYPLVATKKLLTTLEILFPLLNDNYRLSEENYKLLLSRMEKSNLPRSKEYVRNILTSIQLTCAALKGSYDASEKIAKLEKTHRKWMGNFLRCLKKDGLDSWQKVIKLSAKKTREEYCQSCPKAKKAASYLDDLVACQIELRVAHEKTLRLGTCLEKCLAEKELLIASLKKKEEEIGRLHKLLKKKRVKKIKKR